MRRAAVPIAALVVLLAGCSDGVGAAEEAPASASGAPTPLPDLTAAPDAENDASGNPTASPLTEAEKRYIELNGGDGLFEGAVLEQGVEACSRVEFAAQVDQGLLVDDIREGEIAGATGAIPFLCPEYVPQLAEALGGIEDGATETAGLAEGDYAAPAAGLDCEWTLVGSGADEAGDVASGDVAEIELTGDVTTLESSGCVVWLPVSDD
ncbi:hypothetical protein [Paraoerskovia sediminicola]|uniref:hypothetical protein n=1 Tax=Paraoerskovia sediminicola TaxID=1138587 RepID=UPI00257361D6|nr:hypothetical protein [Paraoerskovia sediminicola]